MLKCLFFFQKPYRVEYLTSASCLTFTQKNFISHCVVTIELNIYFQMTRRRTRLDYSSYWMAKHAPNQRYVDHKLSTFANFYILHKQTQHAVDRLNFNLGRGGGYQIFADAACEVLFSALHEDTYIELYNVHQLWFRVREAKVKIPDHRAGFKVGLQKILQEILEELRARRVSNVAEILVPALTVLVF